MDDISSACADAEEVMDDVRNTRAMAKLGELCTDLVDGVEMKFNDFDDVVAELTTQCTEFLGVVGEQIQTVEVKYCFVLECFHIKISVICHRRHNMHATTRIINYHLCNLQRSKDIKGFCAK